MIIEIETERYIPQSALIILPRLREQIPGLKYYGDSWIRTRQRQVLAKAYINNVAVYVDALLPGALYINIFWLITDYKKKQNRRNREVISCLGMKVSPAGRHVTYSRSNLLSAIERSRVISRYA